MARSTWRWGGGGAGGAAARRAPAEGGVGVSGGRTPWKARLGTGEPFPWDEHVGVAVRARGPACRNPPSTLTFRLVHADALPTADMTRPTARKGMKYDTRACARTTQQAWKVSHRICCWISSCTARARARRWGRRSGWRSVARAEASFARGSAQTRNGEEPRGATLEVRRREGRRRGAGPSGRAAGRPGAHPAPRPEVAGLETR